MAKTALDTKGDQWLSYHVREAMQQRQAAVERQAEERWQRAQQLAREAAKRLREVFAARRVILFGSATQRSLFTPWSDVDLAAWGLPPERFYAAVAAVTGLSADIRIDLVDPESCRQGLRQTIEQEGIEL